MLELRSPLAVACHDAGAANIIVARLRSEPALQCRAWVKGPAEKLWLQAFGERACCSSLEQALDGAALLLSGTGWASELEHDARRSAREHGIPSIAVIDHWVNYQARFERNGNTVWPDEFWVTDEYAVTEAKRWFPAERVFQQPNLYVAEQLAKIAPLDAESPRALLYVLEPTRNDWGKGEAGEFQALDYFAQHIAALDLPPNTSLRLRPHPSDPAHKYDAWIARNAQLHPCLPPCIDDSRDLSEAMARCQWVVGCESFAMWIALESGRKVVCTLPPWAPPCRIPHRGIVHLKQLAGDAP